MQSKQGIETGLFGEWLTAYLKQNPKYSDYQVFFDHGDQSTHPNVVEIKGFYGNKSSRYNILTQADMMVVNPLGNISLLIEIEERSSAPKKIIGDVIAGFMCNSYSINWFGMTYSYNITPETKLIVAGILDSHGSKARQLEEIIVPRLKDFVTPKDSINQRNVAFIFKENAEKLIFSLKDTVGALYA